MNTTSVRVLKTKANLLAGTPNLSNTRPSDRNDNERFNGTLLDIGGSRQGKKSTTFGRHKGFHVKTKSIRLKASPELNRQVNEVFCLFPVFEQVKETLMLHWQATSSYF